MRILTVTVTLVIGLLIIAVYNSDESGDTPTAVTTEASSPVAQTAPAVVTTSAGGEDFEQAANIAAEHSKQPLKINIAALEEALKTLRRDQPGAWLEAFEVRANEIYEGDEVISVEAKNHNNRLRITGYIKKGTSEGRSGNDDVVFVIEQNGEVTQGSAPARVTTSTTGGYPVYHHTSLADTMLQYWILHQIFAAPTYRYDTPASRLEALRSTRSDYRTTPSYATQRQTNTSYSGRWNTQIVVPRTSVPSVNAVGGTQSRQPVNTAPVKSDPVTPAKTPITTAAPAAAPTARSTPALASPPAAAPAPVRTAPAPTISAPSTYRSTPSYSAPSSSGGRR